MNGPPAVRKIKEDPAGFSCLILGVSGLSDEADKKAFTDAGADGCVTKPLNLKSFKRIVSGFVNQTV